MNRINRYLIFVGLLYFLYKKHKYLLYFIFSKTNSGKKYIEDKKSKAITTIKNSVFKLLGFESFYPLSNDFSLVSDKDKVKACKTFFAICKV